MGIAKPYVLFEEQQIKGRLFLQGMLFDKQQNMRNMQPLFANDLFLKELPVRPLATMGLRGEVTSQRDFGGLRGSSFVSLKGGSYTEIW